jgi:uncharacterized membrane protein (UPF0127 family)
MRDRQSFHSLAQLAPTFLVVVGAAVLLGALSLVLPAAPVTSAGAAVRPGLEADCGGYSYAEVQIDTYPRLWLEVANTPAERERGLMDRETLDPNSGMLFAFERAGYTSFGMHDTLIPLSIAWLDGNGVIVDIQDMEALSDAIHTPAAAAQYAIEANLGWYYNNGVGVGHQVILCLTPAVAERDFCS